MTASQTRIKGTGIISPVKGLRVHRERAREVLPERLQTYLEQRIRPLEWYPLADHLELMRALIGLVPVSNDPWRWLGQWCASFDLVEVFPTIVRVGDPWETLRRFPQIWTLYHEAGALEVTIGDGRKVRIDLDGFDFAVDEYCRLLTGYFAETLRLSGAEDVEIKCVRCGNGGSASWTASWAGEASPIATIDSAR